MAAELRQVFENTEISVGFYGETECVPQRPETFVKLAKGGFNRGLAVNVGGRGESLRGIRK